MTPRECMEIVEQVLKHKQVAFGREKEVASAVIASLPDVRELEQLRAQEARVRAHLIAETNRYDRLAQSAKSYETAMSMDARRKVIDKVLSILDQDDA